MVRRDSVWLGVAVAALPALGCSGAGAPTGAAPGDEVFTGWSLPGVTLLRSCERRGGEEPRCGLYGRDDASGARLSGQELWARLPTDLSAEERAARAQELVLGRAGEPLLTPEALGLREGVSAEERTILTPPRMEGEVLVVFSYEGETRPVATELRIAGDGTVMRRPALEAWAETAPAAAGPLCLPLSRCGCDEGCVRVDRIDLPTGAPRYRRLDGASPRMLQAHEASGSLGALEEECGEACPPHTAPFTCAVTESGCVQAPRVEESPTPPPPSAP